MINKFEDDICAIFGEVAKEAAETGIVEFPTHEQQMRHLLKEHIDTAVGPVLDHEMNGFISDELKEFLDD